MKSFAQSDINLVVKEHGTISGLISLELLPLYVPSGSKTEVGRFAWGQSLYKCPPKTRIAKIIERFTMEISLLLYPRKLKAIIVKNSLLARFSKPPGGQFMLNLQTHLKTLFSIRCVRTEYKVSEQIESLDAFYIIAIHEYHFVIFEFFSESFEP